MAWLRGRVAKGDRRVTRDTELLVDRGLADHDEPHISPGTPVVRVTARQDTNPAHDVVLYLDHTSALNLGRKLLEAVS